MHSYNGKNIEAIKKIIDTRNCSFGFSEYSQIYAWTNEDIDNTLKLISLIGKERGLTVLSSGDQLFNLVTQKILDIDTFDINRLTEYYALGIKRAAILRYSYENFKIVMDKIYSYTTSFDELMAIMTELFPYMEVKYRLFWQQVLDYIYYSGKHKDEFFSLSKIFIRGGVYPPNVNNYLNSKEDYNTLQNNLSKANITFQCINAIDLPSSFIKSKYDIIILSNILNYFYEYWGYNWTYEQLKVFEEKLELIANDRCDILLHYLYEAENVSHVFAYSNVAPEDLTDEKIILLKNLDRKSGLVLKKVKK